MLNDGFHLIFSRSNLKHILDDLARVSCEIPADFSAIRVLSADRPTLDYHALHHRQPVQGELLRAALAEGPMSASLGATAQVLETGKSLLCPETDMEQVGRAYAGTAFGEY